MITIRALTPVGVEALKIHMKEELALRKKCSKIPKWLRDKKIKDFLAMESTFTDNEHFIRNFVGASENHKIVFKHGVDKAMRENGASLDDYEVIFHDE